MDSRVVFLDSIELASVPPAAVRDASATSSPSLSRKPSYESLASAAWTPTLHKTLKTPQLEVREDQGTRLRRLSMTEPETNDGYSELPPVDKGKGAWLFVVGAFILECFIWGYSYAFATILVYFQRNEPWSQNSLAALSSVATIQLALEFMLPLFVTNLFRRYPEKVKLSLYISAVVYSGSMLVSSWATQVWHLVILQGVLAGAAGAVLYTPVLLWLNGWFHTKRSLASGIVFAGTGMGGFAFPFLIGKLLDDYGFGWMCRVWSFITGFVFLVSIRFIQPRVPLRKPVGPRPKWTAVDYKTINHPIVWTMSITTFISSMAYFPVSLYLASYAAALLPADDSFTVNLVVGIFNAAAMLGSVLTGWGADRSLPSTVAFIGVAGGVVALSAWGEADTLAKVYGFAVLYGASSQICSCWGNAASSVAGANPQTSTTIFCIWGIVRGVASIVGPYISTSLYDETAAHSKEQAWGRFGFHNIIVFVGVMSFLSSFGGAVLAYFRARLAKEKQMGSSGA